jgi:hypothetical protein
VPQDETMERNMGTKLLTIFVLLVGLSQAMASEILLATITRTSDKVKSELILHTDKNEDIKYVLFKIYEEDGKLDRQVKVMPKELPQGKVVLEKMGVDVITLKSDNLAIHNGGNVTIKYLTKFKLFGKDKFANFTVMLDRIGDQWELSKNGVAFNRMLAHTHKKGITKFEIIK